jgi:hypothetical protein
MVFEIDESSCFETVKNGIGCFITLYGSSAEEAREVNELETGEA